MAGPYCVVLFTGSECEEHPGHGCVMEVLGPFSSRKEAHEAAEPYPAWTAPHFMLMDRGGTPASGAEPVIEKRGVEEQASDMAVYGPCLVCGRARMSRSAGTTSDSGEVEHVLTLTCPAGHEEA